MTIIYDLIFLIIAIIYLPIYLFKGKFHHGFWSRLGFLPSGLSFERPIWIHAVSVGEVMAVRPLINNLRKSFPDKKFVISTVTPTGNKIAASLAQEGDFVTYLPLDFSFITAKVIAKINPCLFIIVETELWPNLISSLKKNNIPAVVVNARISDKSFRGYRLIKFLLKPVLNKVDMFFAQSQRDSQRLIALGADEAEVTVSGNMKFDNFTLATGEGETGYRERLGLAEHEKLLIAASTHRGEEKIILAVLKNLASGPHKIRLLIAPRHPERAQEVGNLIFSHGFTPVFISQFETTTHNAQRITHNAVFILDTVGKLMDFYALADIVFVGGSLVKKGGHNILEPVSLAKAVIFGPQMFNFREIAELFLNNKAAVLARNQAELAREIKLFLDNPAKARELGSRARELILKNAGATEKICAYFSNLLIS